MTTIAKGFSVKLFKKSVNIHAEKLIRELGIAKNGFFSEELGKHRASELCSILEAARTRCVSAGMTAVIPSKFNKRGEPIMKDGAVRTAIAEKYSYSEEVTKLCSIDRISKQTSCIDVIKNKIATARIYPNKAQRIKNESILLEDSRKAELASTTEADEAAAKVYEFADHLDIIKASFEEACAIIAADLDMGADEIEVIADNPKVGDEVAGFRTVDLKGTRPCIALNNGDFYLRSACGNHVVWVDKDTYFKAYAKINKLSLPA